MGILSGVVPAVTAPVAAEIRDTTEVAAVICGTTAAETRGTAANTTRGAAAVATDGAAGYSVGGS